MKNVRVATVIAFFISLSFSVFAQYDFMQEAENARWESSLIDESSISLLETMKTVPFNMPNGENGSVTNNTQKLEDGNTYNVLLMSPRTATNGSLRGLYPTIDIEPNARFQGKVGFPMPVNNQTTDAARFLAFLHYWENGEEQTVVLVDVSKRYSGLLQSFDVSLEDYVGKKAYFELRVDAGESTEKDQASWVEPKITSSYSAIQNVISNAPVMIYEVTPQPITKTVTPKSLENLCPNQLVGGDLEFGGNGPRVFGDINLVLSNDKKQIVAMVKFNAQETKSDWITGRSEVKGFWEKTVYTAPDGYTIESMNGKTMLSDNYNKVLQGGGQSQIFTGNGDGSPHFLQGQRELSGDDAVDFIKLVGDTGGTDISTDNNCSGDTRIIELAFKSLDVVLIPTN